LRIAKNRSAGFPEKRAPNFERRLPLMFVASLRKTAVWNVFAINIELHLRVEVVFVTQIWILSDTWHINQGNISF